MLLQQRDMAFVGEFGQTDGWFEKIPLIAMRP